MIEYKIVADTSEYSMESSVQTELRAGFELASPLVVVRTDYGPKFVQALIKDTERANLGT